jgi:hypothetical protein
VTQTGWVVDVWTSAMSDERASRPPGEWNRFEITALGQEYTVVLNGVTTHRFTGDKRGQIDLVKV